MEQLIRMLNELEVSQLGLEMYCLVNGESLLEFLSALLD